MLYNKEHEKHIACKGHPHGLDIIEAESKTGVPRVGFGGPKLWP